MLMECTRVPLVPVTVTVAGPVAAVPLASNVNVLLLVVLAGTKVAVTPDGNPEADKLTLPLKPLRSFSVIVVLLLEPWSTATLLGEAESEKSGEAFTVKITLVVCVRLPDVPVMVT